MKKNIVSSVIVISLIILSLTGLSGCTSSKQEEERAKELEKNRADVEKLKQQNKNAEVSYDSLNSEVKRKDEALRKLHQELDSLQKNIEKEENNK